jgi:hypothetical protein
LNRENIHGDVLELLKKAKTDLHEELTRLKKEKFSTDIEIGKLLDAFIQRMQIMKLNAIFYYKSKKIWQKIVNLSRSN